MITLYAGLDDVIQKNPKGCRKRSLRRKSPFGLSWLYGNSCVTLDVIQLRSEEKKRKKKKRRLLLLLLLSLLPFLTAPVFFTSWAQGGDLLLKLNCIAA
jgi:hypothetical protein